MDEQTMAPIIPNAKVFTVVRIQLFWRLCLLRFVPVIGAPLQMGQEVDSSSYLQWASWNHVLFKTAVDLVDLYYKLRSKFNEVAYCNDFEFWNNLAIWTWASYITYTGLSVNTETMKIKNWVSYDCYKI